LSCVLTNGEERPVTFISRVLNKAEQNYSVIVKEALAMAIFWAVRKLSQYLLGRRFILVTDHKPLLAIFGEKNCIPTMTAGKLQCWAVFLTSFDYEIKYIKGTDNNVADGLSRLPLDGVKEEVEEEYLKFIERACPIDANCIRVETKKDVLLSKVVQYLDKEIISPSDSEVKPYLNKRNELYVEKGILMWGYRMVIPKVLQEGLLAELHSTHMGSAKMKNLARSYFWWPNIDGDIEQYIKRCVLCMEMRLNPPLAKLVQWSESKGVF